MPKRNSDQELLQNRTKSNDDAIAFLEFTAKCLKSGRVPKDIGTELASVLTEAAMLLDNGQARQAKASLSSGFGLRERTPETKRKANKTDQLWELEFSEITDRRVSDKDIANRHGLERSTVQKFRKEARDKIEVVTEYMRWHRKILKSFQAKLPGLEFTMADLDKAFPEKLPVRPSKQQIDRLIAVTHERLQKESS